MVPEIFWLTVPISTFSSSCTYVWYAPTSQVSIFIPEAVTNENGMRMSNWRWEFDGTFLTTPVTWNSNHRVHHSKCIILPIGSSSPKYFFAVSSVRMIKLGSENDFLGLPFTNGNVKISMKEGSTPHTLTWKTLSSNFKGRLTLWNIRAEFFISGYSSFSATASGPGPTAE